MKFENLNVMQIYFVKHFSKRIEKTNVKRGPDADNYHYFTWDNKGGTTGIAGEGTVCAKLKSHKTGITEWVHNEDEHYSETQCVLANIFFLILHFHAFTAKVSLLEI